MKKVCFMLLVAVLIFASACNKQPNDPADAGKDSVQKGASGSATYYDAVGCFADLTKQAMLIVRGTVKRVEQKNSITQRAYVEVAETYVGECGDEIFVVQMKDAYAAGTGREYVFFLNRQSGETGGFYCVGGNGIFAVDRSDNTLVPPAAYLNDADFQKWLKSNGFST